MMLIRYVALLLLLGLARPIQAQLQVTSVSPMPEALQASAETAITVQFDQAVNPETFDARSVMVQGRWSGVVPGTMTFEDAHHRLRFLPDRPFFAGETVTVNLARHLASADGEAMAKGYAWQFWIRTRAAFADLQETARLSVRTEQEQQNDTQIQTYGAYAGDLDADGFTDFIVPNERTRDVRVFMNDGQGNYDDFTIYDLPNGASPSTNEGADFNHDGHLDFAVGNRGSDQVSVFFGDGTGSLSGPTDYTTDEGVRGLTVLDANGDGSIDIATAHRDAGTVRLLLNNGDGTFTVTAAIVLKGATAISAADANGDGILDLYVGQHEDEDQISLLLGDGEGSFSESDAVFAGGASWMVATGDVNGDGRADLVSANSNDNNFSVVLTGADAQLVQPTIYDTGNFPLAIDLGDLDGDGDLDLVTSNFASGNWTVFENAGDGTFGNPRSLPASRAGSCAVFHDRNNDGALDMTGIDELEDLLFLFTNTPLPVNTEEQPDRPSATLYPAYPNPFTEQTTLHFRLAAPGPVRLAVYDVLGRRVRVLHDDPLPAGEHRITWDGLDEADERLAGSTYLLRLETPNGFQSQNVVYLPTR